MSQTIAAFLPQVRISYDENDTESNRDFVHEAGAMAIGAFATREGAEAALRQLVSEAVDEAGEWRGYGDEDGEPELVWARDEKATEAGRYENAGGGFWFVARDAAGETILEGRALVREVSITLR